MVLHTSDEVVLLLGAPGAGKGTQARLLAEELAVPHVASGDLLRDHRRRGTALGQRARVYMDQGDLVPDTLVVDMIVDRLHETDAAGGALLDGFPRTLPQARSLDARLAERGGAVRSAIYIKVPRSALVERLAGRRLCRVCQASYHIVHNPSAAGDTCDVCGGQLYQRLDDTREVVDNRVAVYLRDTVPVIEHYQELGVLHVVDGNRAIDDVHADVLAAAGLRLATLAESGVGTRGPLRLAPAGHS